MGYDNKFMERCIQLAQCGEYGAAPNPMVGAVIVHKGRILGEGYHCLCGGPHAEVNAIHSVKQKELLHESTLYVSLEPCAHYGKTPPCADLIIANQIPQVVVGTLDPFAKVNGLGVKKMRDAGIEVIVGVMEKECRALNERFFTFHRKKRPWILLKWAQSQDGFIAQEDGTPVTFSTVETQVLMHRLRAYNKAVMIGTRTALIDNPSLTTRYWPGPNPVRVTVDRHDILPNNLKIKQEGAETRIYSCGKLSDILADLYQRNIQSLMVEGGTQLLQSFIDEGLWDEIRIETSPMRLRKGIVAPAIAYAKNVEETEIDGNSIRILRPLNYEF